MLIIRPSMTAKIWAIYSHSIGAQLLWIGVCRQSELFAAPDAQRNTEWRKLVTADTHVMLEFLALCSTQEAAIDRAGELIMERKPWCNMNGSQYGRTTGVRSVTDNREFATASEAARHYGLTRQAMSNHLNARPGYTRIGGHVFERI